GAGAGVTGAITMLGLFALGRPGQPQMAVAGIFEWCARKWSSWKMNFGMSQIVTKAIYTERYFGILEPFISKNGPES
ncbi:MAG: hypothetical protein AAF591_12360, partial [Verrucomicrobiota bacterium]